MIVGVTAVIVSLAITLSVFKLFYRRNAACASIIVQENNDIFVQHDSTEIHFEQNSMKFNFLNNDSNRMKNQYQVY